MTYSTKIPVVFLTLLLGCTGCTKPMGKVSGSVSIGDKPVVWGTVNLQSEDGKSYQGQIDADGKYSIDDVPYGKYRAMVHSPDPSPPTAAGPPRKKNTATIAPANELQELRKKWTPLAEKYDDFQKSGLSTTIDQPKVVFDIPLKGESSMGE